MVLLLYTSVHGFSSVVCVRVLRRLKPTFQARHATYKGVRARACIAWLHEDCGHCEAAAHQPDLHFPQNTRYLQTGAHAPVATSQVAAGLVLAHKLLRAGNTLLQC